MTSRMRMFRERARKNVVALLICASIVSSVVSMKSVPSFVSVSKAGIPTDIRTRAATRVWLASSGTEGSELDMRKKTRQKVEEAAKEAEVIPDFTYSYEEELEASELMKLDSLTFQEYIETIWSNMAGGEPGKRGELYFGAQTALVFLILVGELPLVGDPLKVFMGSGAIFGGIGAIIAGVVELGDQLSAWPVPVYNKDGTTDSKIVETGIYSLVRHPIYAGLISICGGFSFMTDSSMRLFYTILLYYCLEKKSQFEEAKIIDEDPSYIIYREEVRGKFIPHEIVEALPWEDKGP